MNERLKKTMEALEGLPAPHKVINLGGPAVRSRDLIHEGHLDIDEDTIVKTIMFKSKHRGVFSVAVRSKDRVSYKKLKTLLEDKSISTLRPETMRELGWEPGECCPLSVPDPLIIDQDVMGLDWIHSGSGDLHYGLEYPPSAIKRIRDIRVADVKEEEK